MLSNIHKTVRNAVFIKQDKIIPPECDELAWVRLSAQDFAGTSRFLLEEIRAIVERPPRFLPEYPDAARLSLFVSSDRPHCDETSTALECAATAYEQTVQVLDAHRNSINSKGEFTKMADQLEECVDTAQTILISCISRDRTWHKLQSETKARKALDERLDNDDFKYALDVDNTQYVDLQSDAEFELSLSEEMSSPKIIKKRSMLMRVKSMTVDKSIKSKDRLVSSSRKFLETNEDDREYPSDDNVREIKTLKSDLNLRSTNGGWGIKMGRKNKKETREERDMKMKSKQRAELNMRIARHDEKIQGLKFMLKEQGAELVLEFHRLLGNRLSLMEEVVAELFHNMTEYALKGARAVSEIADHVPTLLSSARERRSLAGLPTRRFSWEMEMGACSPKRGTDHGCRTQEFTGPELFALNTNRFDGTNYGIEPPIETEPDASDSSSDLPPPTSRTRMNQLNPARLRSSKLLAHRTPPPALNAWSEKKGPYSFEGEIKLTVSTEQEDVEPQKEFIRRIGV
eukprot:GHVH01005878.1.p1 GENE.GHVH01005878.1~~GHVH01005878.1.p1  ORF type:complete len:515 (-),score=65.76 GHVH01005878.1:914-2458(-)